MIRILGIETSCDETAVALYEGDMASGQGRILGGCSRSQIDIHARFGGVVPEIASREHLIVLPAMVADVMAQANVDWSTLNAIAVTAGPGLMGGLLVGVSFAQAAGLANGIEVLPVHHMEGHLLAPGIDSELPEFPFVTLLVSGGHTLLVRVDGIGEYQVIGQTIDDAAGECFDKSARILGLPYPGGPEISQLARDGRPDAFSLPRPLLNRNNLDFSFSGLKTAVLYASQDADMHDAQTRRDLAASVETAICDVLVKKSLAACARESVSALVIAGGVAANRTLRSMLEVQGKKQGIRAVLPGQKYCTDNAAMIAYAGFQRMRHGLPAGEDGWDVRSRWSLSELSQSKAA